jgi:hypothetical protein
VANGYLFGENMKSSAARKFEEDSSEEFIFGIKDYLFLNDLEQKLDLSPTGNLSFHWADWRKTCIFKKALAINSKECAEAKEELDRALEELKGLKAWVTRKGEVLEVSYYDLYYSYLDPRMRLTWFDSDEESDLQVSLVNKSGPFFGLDTMRWFDHKIYHQFIFWKIFQKGLPMREFRVRFNSALASRGSDGNWHQDLLWIKQMSENGFVIEIRDKKSFDRIILDEKIELSLNLEHFKGCLVPNVEVIQNHFGRLDSNLFSFDSEQATASINVNQIAKRFENKSVDRFSSFREYHIFIPFSDISFQHIEDRELLPQFVKNLENLLLKELED